MGLLIGQIFHYLRWYLNNNNSAAASVTGGLWCGLDWGAPEELGLNYYQGENFIQLTPPVCFGYRRCVSLPNLKEQNPSSHRRKPVSKKVHSPLFPGFRRSPE